MEQSANSSSSSAGHHLPGLCEGSGVSPLPWFILTSVPPPPHWAHPSPAPFEPFALLAGVGSCRYLDTLTLKSPPKLWPLVPLYPLPALPPIHFPHWVRIHKRVVGKESPSHWVGMDHNDLVPSMVLLRLPWWLRR